jgi:hypothetical protein
MSCAHMGSNSKVGLVLPRYNKVHRDQYIILFCGQDHKDSGSKDTVSPLRCSKSHRQGQVGGVFQKMRTYNRSAVVQ